MAKGLPYFEFWTSEWLTGDICFEDLETQGLFINICALYWQRNGDLLVSDIERRYNKPNAFNSLTDRIISVSDGLIKIAFLDEQLLARKHKSKVNSENGSKGGRPKTKEIKPNALVSLTEIKPNQKAIEENRREENRIEDNKREENLHPLQKWIKETKPFVSKISSQLSFAECERLVIQFDKTTLQNILENMENYKGVEKKYTSVNLTVRKWIAKDIADKKNLPAGQQADRPDLQKAIYKG